MKICIAYRTTKKPWGGTNSFIRNLERFFDDRGIARTRNWRDDFDILLLNGAYEAPGRFLSPRHVKNVRRTGYRGFFDRLLCGFRRRRIPILYRLDGLRRVYADVESPMDRIQLEVLAYADHIVFQSRFALECFQKHGYRGDRHSVIPNGVDANLFNPANACEWKQGSVFRIASCSWSSNPAKGHERISLFSTFPGVEVSHAGHWPDTVSPRNVRLLGPLDQHGIASLFKRSHGFIFPAAHESCSNVLLEALAAGLPVLYADSGGNREIAGNYGTALDSVVERNVFERYKLHYAEYRRRILSERERFSIRHAGRNYLECIKKLLETSGGSHAPFEEVPRS